MCSERRWDAGNVAVDTATGKLPLGSLASCRVPPPQPGRTSSRKRSTDQADAPGGHGGPNIATALRAHAGSRGTVPIWYLRAPARTLARSRRVAADQGGWSRFDQSRRRSRVLAHQGFARRGRQHDDPDRQDAGLRGAPAIPVRPRVRRAVHVRAAAVLVPAADLDDRVRVRGAGSSGRELPRAVRRARSARGFLRARVDPRVRAVRRRDRARRRRRAPRSPPTSAPARSARSSTRSRCSASTRSRTWSCRGSSR